jgi:putative transcriptional regulator
MERRTIRELRRLAGWSQIELAAKIGVSKMSISHWETGRNEPSARQLRALAQAFATPWNRSASRRKRCASDRREDDQ